MKNYQLHLKWWLSPRRQTPLYLKTIDSTLSQEDRVAFILDLLSTEDQLALTQLSLSSFNKHLYFHVCRFCDKAEVQDITREALPNFLFCVDCGKMVCLQCDARCSLKDKPKPGAQPGFEDYICCECSPCKQCKQ